MMGRSELSANPTAGIADDLRAIVSRLRHKLRDQGSLGDLTPSQVSVLKRLEQGEPATISDLARAEGVRPQSMGATVAALEAAGLINGSPDPGDGRRILLGLTPACRDRAMATRLSRQDWLVRTIQHDLTAAERRQLATGLALLKRVIAA